LPVVSVPLELVDVPDLDDGQVAASVARDRARAFDPSSAPLMRARLYRSAADGGACVVSLLVDHLVIDGWSLWTLLDELGEILDAGDEGSAERAPFEPPREYFDYVVEEQQWLQGPRARKQVDYW